MSRLKSKKGITLLAVLAVALTAAAGAAALANRVEETPAAELTVHEWGTFTSFAGASGVLAPFRPDSNDLPQFVHRAFRGKSSFGGPQSLVSMETPVLYFYSDRELTASVDVVFPHGRMTEWYPRQSPSTPPSWLRYEKLRIFAAKDGGVITEDDPRGVIANTIDIENFDPDAVAPAAKPSRYFAARETDANLVQVEWEDTPTASPSWLGTVRQKLGWKEHPIRQTETEKFIFYRGVADLTLPLTVTTQAGGTVTIKNTCKTALTGAVLVRVQDGKIYFREVGKLPNGGTALTAHLPEEPSTTTALGETLVRSLVGAGLYEKEARAMVKTWDSAWFGEEGTRLLYLLPQTLTDDVLPLRISPQPREQIRVLVGRHDFLTPEREREIARMNATLQQENAPEAEKEVARKGLNRLGRFSLPAQNAALRATKPAATAAE